MLMAVLALTAHAQTAGEPYELARLGAEVDADERAYFLLFPSLPEADTLRLAWAGPDEVRVASSAGDGLTMSVEQVRVLDAVLERYETLFAAPDPSLNTTALAGLIRWRLPTEDRPLAVVTLRDREVEGWILDADADGLVLATERPERVPREADLVWVPAPEAVRVRQVGFRSGLDVRTGGDLARYRAEAMPALREAAWFLRGLPPELLAWRRRRPAISEAEPPPRDDQFANVPLNRWDAGFSLHAGVVDAGTTVTDPFGASPPYAESWLGWVTGGQARLAYNVTASVGVEVAQHLWVSQPMKGAVLDERQYVAATTDLSASYAFLPSRLGRVSLTARGGASVVKSWSMTVLRSSSDLSPSSFEEQYTVSSPLRLGGLVGVGAAFRISRGISSTAELGWAVYPGIEEGEIGLTEPRPGARFDRVEARSFALQFRGLEAGVVLHLGTR